MYYKYVALNTEKEKEMKETRKYSKFSQLFKRTKRLLFLYIKINVLEFLFLDFYL